MVGRARPQITAELSDDLALAFTILVPCDGGFKIARIRQTEPEKPTKYQMAIPGQLESVVMKLLAKRPEDRYQSATELIKELTRVGKFNGVTV